jgi:RNA polymerase sigma-70 factor, ECF subfamily
LSQDHPFETSRSSFLRMRNSCHSSTLSSMTTPALSAGPSDAVLLERVACGDTGAYELIYTRYHRPAHSLANRLCGRNCIAEEVVQEALLSVWRNAGSYTQSRGSARGWIFTIVRNRAIDARRRRGGSEREEAVLDGLEEHLAGPAFTDVEAERRERRRAVHRALGRLPAAQREAVVLSHFRGLTNHETATVVGRSIGTVKGRIRLGHARLRRDLVAVAGVTT